MDYQKVKSDLREAYIALSSLEAAWLAQRICFYEPLVHGDQRDFFSKQCANIRLVLGDNRSGKSETGVVEAVSHMLGYRPWLDEDHPDRIVKLPSGRPIPVPNIGRVVAQDYQQAIRQNIWPKFQKYLPHGSYTVRTDNRGIPVEVRMKKAYGGSVCYFMSDDQDDMVFEGTNGHWFWVDEPIGYRKYIALTRGLVDFGGHCWLTLTPLSQPWISDVIESRGNDPDGKVVVFEFSIWDNCTEVGGHLPREAIEEFIANLSPDEKAARIGRQWLHLQGRIFKEWHAKPPYWISPFNIPNTWPRVCCIDPHPRKPIAVLWVAISPDNQKFVYRELFDETLVTVRDVADRMKELEGWEKVGKKLKFTEEAEPIAMRLIDPSSQENERTSGESVFSRFNREGMFCMLARKRNILAGLDAIHEALKIKGDWQEPGVVVFNTCPTVKMNFARYVYDDWASSKQRDDKGPKQTVKKINDDMIDNIRYIFQANITYKMLTFSLQQNGHSRRERGIGLVSGQVYA